MVIYYPFMNSVMKSIHTTKYLLRFVFSFALLSCIIACSDNDSNSSKYVENDVTWRASSTVGAAEGSSGIIITGLEGTGWTAEVIEGATWCSFGYNTIISEKSGEVSDGLNMLYIYYPANTSTVQRSATISFKFDDDTEAHLLTLTQIAVDQQNAPPFGRWAELPAYKAGANFDYVIHYALLNNATVRNYSFCYDKNKKAALWVAYPLHSAYLGSGSRTDAWAYDPIVPESYQPYLFKSYKGSYDRGHQLPSADRLANYELNAQTFYFTNMTPQMARLNQDMWANLETKVRNNVCSDTLYVVTGAFFGTGAGTTTDGDGVTVPIPTQYYKVLLRTKDGRTGKSIRECTADELISIGIWVNQENYGNIQPPTSICTTVAEIEEKTGFNFFPQVDASVKQQKNPAIWGIN